MNLRNVSRQVLDVIHPSFNQQDNKPDHKSRLLEARIDYPEIRDRYKSYLVTHYLGLHITVVSVTLAVAGVAAASLITQPMGADHQLLILWLLWVGSLAATAVAYGGPMVGAFALPASIPAIIDLLLPLIVGIVEFLLFTILIHQVTATSLTAIVNTWLVLIALFAIFAEFSVLRARHHYVVAVRDGVYSKEVAKIVKIYLRYLRRDLIAAAMLALFAAMGAGLRISEAVVWPSFAFPLPITIWLLLGLLGHSETAKMWRELLSSHKQGNGVSDKTPPLAQNPGYATSATDAKRL